MNPYRKTISAAEFNPKAHGGVSKSGSVVSGDSNMFNERGILNASTNKEALSQIAYIHQSGAASLIKKESAIDKAAKSEAILAAFQSDDGLRKIGSELLAPIKEIVDYESWTRKLLRVRPLAQGELFRLTKDIVNQTTAWVIGEDGQTPESRVRGRYITIPEFKVTGFASIDIEDIYKMQYDGLDRAQDLIRQSIERTEDQAMVAALESAATTSNDVTYFTSLGVAAFEDVRYQVEQHRLVVDKFLISRRELSDIVTTMSAAVDPVTERELILSGYIGNILNAQIITSAGTGVFEVVPAGTIYAIPAPEYLGDFGIRLDLFSEPYNQLPNQAFVKGWAFAEIVGIGLPNANAVAKGIKV